MPEVKANIEFETKSSIRRKTNYRTGAGRLSWGEGIISPPLGSNKQTKNKKSFRVSAKKAEE